MFRKKHFVDISCEDTQARARVTLVTAILCESLPVQLSGGETKLFSRVSLGGHNHRESLREWRTDGHHARGQEEKEGEIKTAERCGKKT